MTCRSSVRCPVPPVPLSPRPSMRTCTCAVRHPDELHDPCYWETRTHFHTSWTDSVKALNFYIGKGRRRPTSWLGEDLSRTAAHASVPTAAAGLPRGQQRVEAAAVRGECWTEIWVVVSYRRWPSVPGRRPLPDGCSIPCSDCAGSDYLKRSVTAPRGSP
jgi:hypothetical protein